MKTLLFIVIILISLLVACGDNNSNNQRSDDEPTHQLIEHDQVNYTGTPEKTLSVLAREDFRHDFINGIPIADSQGRLLLDPEVSMDSSTWASASISASGNGELAWEFIQYLVSSFSRPQQGAGIHPWGRYSMTTPIKRNLFETHLAAAFEEMRLYTNSLAALRIDIESHDWLQLVDDAMDRLFIFNEMPMARAHSHIPNSLFWDNFEIFMMGLMTAEEFAEQLHNAVSLWLIE